MPGDYRSRLVASDLSELSDLSDISSDGESTVRNSFVQRTLASQKVLPPFRWSNILNELQWISFLVLTITPALAIYGLFTVHIQRNTLIWAIVYYYMTGLGITAGYHRLWSHRAYTASRPLEYALMCMGSGSVEGSIHWWARGHRSHHRYTDTDLDPYGAHTGLVWAHIGWMIVKPRRKPGPVDISDLRKNPVVKFQHKYYIPLILFWGFVFPTLVAGLGWGDWKGGFFYAAIARLVFVHHSTFCINSLAHYLGEATFDRKNSPRDNVITALCTVGEGYHNFHHEFPMDFRNAIKWYQYDPTKWFIWIMSKLGLATNLKRFPDNEIRKGRLAMQLADAYDESSKLKFATRPQDLPVITWDDFVEQAKTRPLIVVHGYIHDMSNFMDEHPGGREFIAQRIGKDASVAFSGGVYEHSNAAHNLLSMMRVGVLSGGYELAARDTAASTAVKPPHTSMLKYRMDSATSASETDEPTTPTGVSFPTELSTEPSMRVRTDAATYVAPGEAYTIVQNARLGENVRVKGTSWGKLL
ncbi:stearoyl-CoA 9-desaturase [Malassezia pachydermatis]|uniref:stearoyl-CoA 9-desaturase n=1 Tax=Malassezia pachydermatis TaxID=77020 RepID=A0A0M8MNI8_9BASI|nr:stearoyl- desaturase (delta-9 desaturase) [Malassezia pachydermatis]KOS16076.1 stearoyl- desaturase (delta-9 desaturase) [Malassezia pachydermatis]